MKLLLCVNDEWTEIFMVVVEKKNETVKCSTYQLAYEQIFACLCNSVVVSCRVLTYCSRY